MNDTQRLDFLDLLIKTEIPVGIKPGFRALVGSAYIEGPTNIRELIDKLKYINDNDIPEADEEPNADQSTNIKK